MQSAVSDNQPIGQRARLSGACDHLDFIVIGAMKAGSTSLFNFLAGHPSVHIPTSKEPHYFSMRYHYPTAYYKWLFRGRRANQITGEASTSYSNVHRFPECPKRIAEDAPNVRIVYLIRDPLERILSNLRHLDLSGRGGESEQLLNDASLWNKSRYRDTVEAYLEYFPRSSIFVADLADIRTGEEWLRRVLTFLDLEQPTDSVCLPTSNVSGRRAKVAPWLGGLARSPVGSVLRDLLPRQQIKRIRAALAKPTTGATDDIARMTSSDLRSAFPDACAELDAQYLWVRRHFIDGEATTRGEEQ